MILPSVSDENRRGRRSNEGISGNSSGRHCRGYQPSVCEKEGAVNSRNSPCFSQSPLERLPCILAVDGALDTGDAEQGGDANGRFGSLGLLQGQRQKIIRHECSLPDR
jgi:hypothetical protein